MTHTVMSWLIGWRDRLTGETGNEIVRAVCAQEAVYVFEINNPSRRVTNVHQSPVV